MMRWMLWPSFEKLEFRPGGDRFSFPAFIDQGDLGFPSLEASFSQATDEV
jgi:hypothetical protein